MSKRTRMTAVEKLALFASTYARHQLLHRLRSRALLERYQRAALARQLAWVSQRSPLYRDLVGRPLADYPIVDKSVFIAEFDRLNTIGARKLDAEAIALRAEGSRDFSPKLGNHTVGMSSGTSGHRGIFLVSEAEEVKWTAMLLARVLPRSLLSPTRIALFLRANSNLFESLKRGKIEFRFFDLMRPADELARAVDAYAPDVLIATGSLLKLLAGYRDRGDITLDPGRIYATAEVLDPIDQTAIEAAFGRAVHQIYHCTEGFLGISCAYGTIHLNETWLHVEREYLDATRFVPVITDLERRTQPIIRYRLNDVLALERDGCPCGSPCTALRSIEGREDDIFYVPRHDGSLAPVFADAIRAVIMGQRVELAEYKVVQRAPSRLEVALKRGAGNGELERRIADDFSSYFDKLGLVAPTIAFTPYVEPLRLAKLKRVERAFQLEKAGSS